MYPVPWQDVPPGADRDEPWLALDEDAITTRLWLRTLGESLHRSALYATHPAMPPVSRAYWDRMKSPRAGDLVLEVSTPGILPGRLDGLIKGLGFLVCTREEYIDTDEEWEQVKDQYRDQPRPADQRWYVQYGQAAADVCRWENCRFVALPKLEDEFRIGDTPPQAVANGWRA